MTHDELFQVVGWAFPVAAAAVGLWMLARVGPSHRHDREFYASLVPVRARVLEIRKVVGSAPNGTDPQREYHYRLGYYGPDGRPHETWSAERASLNRLVQGQEVTAYCLPDRPDHVVLNRRSPARQAVSTATTAALGVAFLAVAAVVLYLRLR